MVAFFVKAEGVYDKGVELDKLWLNTDSVRKAIARGFDISSGKRVSVKVKVGKKRKVIKAYITREVAQCCQLHHGELIGYIAEK